MGFLIRDRWWRGLWNCSNQKFACAMRQVARLSLILRRDIEIAMLLDAGFGNDSALPDHPAPRRPGGERLARVWRVEHHQIGWRTHLDIKIRKTQGTRAIVGDH